MKLPHPIRNWHERQDEISFEADVSRVRSELWDHELDNGRREFRTDVTAPSKPTIARNRTRLAKLGEAVTASGYLPPKLMGAFVFNAARTHEANLQQSLNAEGRFVPTDTLRIVFSTPEEMLADQSPVLDLERSHGNL